MELTRRRLLRASAVGAGLAALGPVAARSSGSRALAQAVPLAATFDPEPFPLGVASGDPLPEGVLLWTRLAVDPLLPDERPSPALPERVEVDWVVAADPRLRRVVRSGSTVADVALAHSVRVDVTGLEPGTTYWYRFAAQGRVSRVGRTRTAPVGPLERLRFAFVSCQDFEDGFYPAFRHLAREGVAFVVHLGDYIYESDGSGNGRDHPEETAATLATYRARHALYKGDLALRAAHAAFPWIVTWDDHEVDNNYAGLVPQDVDEGRNDDFAQRRADAYRAYFEHLPVRVDGPPTGPDLRIYRELSFGDLLDVAVLDTRQYRTDQPCDDEQLTAACSEVDDPEAEMLGPDQSAWLAASLTGSRTAWRCLANQVMVGQLKVGGVPSPVGGVLESQLVPTSDGSYVNPDQWDGYQVPRAELLGLVAEQGIPDVVVITGDFHVHWVSDLKVDFDDPTDPVVATEFVGTAISSGGDGDEGTSEALRAAAYPTNRHIRYVEAERRGYAVVELDRERWRTIFKVVETVAEPISPLSVLAAFEVDRGRPGARQVAGANGNPIPRAAPS